MAGQPYNVVTLPTGQVVNMWVFDVTDTQCIELGTGVILPGMIVNSGNNFRFTTTLTNTGPLGAPFIAAPGTTGRLDYYCEDMATGTRVTLPFQTFNMNASTVTVDSASFLSGPTGVLGLGTWEITVYAHFPGTPFQGVVAGFYQLHIEVI